VLGLTLGCSFVRNARTTTPCECWIILRP